MSDKVTQHTQEPWVLDQRGYPHADIKAESGRSVAVTWGVCSRPPKNKDAYDRRTETDRANAIRIVACVNACAGIDTDVLEQIGTLVQSDAGFQVRELYTTPQPADTVPVERFNKLLEACELYEEACSYNDATPTFNRLIKKADALKSEAMKGE